METVAIAAVIKQIAINAGALAAEELSCLWWLKENVEWLKREMDHMNGYLQDAENKQATSEGVHNLLKNIRELCWDVEDVLDNFLPRIESYKSRRGYVKKMLYMFPYACRRTMLNREITKIRRRVEGIDQDRKTFGIEDRSVPQDQQIDEDPRTNTVYSDEPIVIGFDRRIEELKNMLLKRDNTSQAKNRDIAPVETKIVSIVGMSGVGKTTLAKKVFEHIIIDKGFDCHAKVSISQKPNIEAILKDVAEQVGMEEERTRVNLRRNLHEYLKYKHFALILDDIWEKESWDDLSECFPRKTSGSAIIVTSQNVEVGRYICGNDSSLHELKPFDPYSTHSWDLFSQVIDPSSKGVINSELEGIGRDIVRRCGNLPLAIKVAAGMLRGKGENPRAWREVLNGMDNHDSRDKCLQILKLSYKNLPTKLKPCFLCLGLFPEDYKIRSAEVITMWMAENFIERTQNQEAEEIGETYLDILHTRNLIQVVDRKYDGRIRSFTIHDRLHSLCINLSKESMLFHTQIDHGDHTRFRRLVIHRSQLGHDESFLKTLPTKLRSLFIYGYGFQNLNCKLGRFSFLKVLRLELYEDMQSLTTDGLGDLRHLKQLFIGLYADSLSISGCICNMKKLQALEVREGSAIELPICIWKMEQLRHLLLCKIISVEFTKHCNGKSPNEVSLPNLQTLETPYYINKSELVWPTKFPNLRKLKVKNPDLARRLLTEVKEKNSRSIEGYLTPNLIQLTLDSIRIENDPMEVLKKLPNLKILKLKAHSYLGRKIDCSGANSFPCLQVLHLEKLPNLRQVIREREALGSTGMSNLRQLIVKDCPELKNVPQSLQQILHGSLAVITPRLSPTHPISYNY